MVKGSIRHMFPGGNTPQGFYSFYSYILAQENATRIFSVKGGPGVGKSSFMRKIGEEMIERGYNVEYMHCSSDNNSLDGLVIPALRIALIDGTAPHVVDPKNPGAVDEIIHLGDYWNEEGFRENREKVIADNREVGRIFARAYRYLRAAAAIYEDNMAIYSWAVDHAKVNLCLATVVDELFREIPIASGEGSTRCLFGSAITPDGLKNHLPSILNTSKVYTVAGYKGTGTEKLLERVKTEAVSRGYDVEAYYCPIRPDLLEHLVIPDMDIAFTTVNKYHDAKIASADEIDFNQFLDADLLNTYEKEIEYNDSEFDALLNSAIYTIGKAKAIHDRMETYYIPNMDFEAVNRCRESILARILEYAEANVEICFV